MRILRNTALTLLVFFCIGGIAFTFWLRDRYVVPILTYHHVGICSSKWRLNIVSESSFDYQMSFIKRHGFHVISLDDLVEGIKKGQQFERNTVVLTFDDGYEDNYLSAFPILKKYDFPATIFLVSAKVGSKGFLTWNEIKEMEKGNLNFGTHTQHHTYLPKVSLQEANEEIAGSKRDIEAHLGHTIFYFAYPTGGFNEEIKALVKNAGYKAAATTNRGKDRYNLDLYELKRIHMNNTDNKYSGLIMWFKLSGYYNLFRQFKDSGGINKKGLYE